MTDTKANSNSGSDAGARVNDGRDIGREVGREISVAHQTDKSRYVLMVDGQEAGFAAYVDTDDFRDFNHTVVHPDFRGQGLSAPLIKQALDDSKEHQKPIKPSCSAVAVFIDKNPEYQALLP